MERLKMSAQILKILLLAIDASLIFYKMAKGKSFSLPEFFSYVILNIFLIHIIFQLDDT
jgi:hypothetical protein